MTRYRIGQVEAQGAERGILFSDSASFTVPTGRRSHYDGLLVRRYDPTTGFGAIKLLDSVRFDEAGEIEQITHEPDALIVEYESGLIALFTLASSSRSTTLQIQTSVPVSGGLRFDIRHVYDSAPYHKIYTVDELGSRGARSYRIGFEKRTDGDSRFDITAELRVALHGVNVSCERSDAWVCIDDPFDARRTGQHEQHHVYEPISFSACETIIVTTKTRPSRITRSEREHPIADRRGAAVRAARNQLEGSLLKRGSAVHVIAGHPWFFQEWSRDAAISIGGLRGIVDEAARVRILMRLAKSLAESEASIQADAGSLRSADAMGLVMFRLSEETLTERQRSTVARILAEHLRSLEDRINEDGLLTSGPRETWMDTGEGFRAGACIEIQALYARMLAFAQELTGDDTYGQRLGSFIDSVRTHFIGEHGRIIDHIDEAGNPSAYTAHNEFLAYVVFPGLFEPGTWHWSFDHALDALTADGAPGLIFSLEPGSPLFCRYHTGEDDRSYHRGDSWLFMNHITALALARLDRHRYGERIEAIIETSLHDCLELGAFCGFSEVSSAQEQDSNGCWAQTWSAATFLELIDALD